LGEDGGGAAGDEVVQRRGRRAAAEGEGGGVFLDGSAGGLFGFGGGVGVFEHGPGGGEVLGGGLRVEDVFQHRAEVRVVGLAVSGDGEDPFDEAELARPGAIDAQVDLVLDGTGGGEVAHGEVGVPGDDAELLVVRVDV
jgi:hypothetical protein